MFDSRITNENEKEEKSETPQDVHRVCIIGAGPSGLATAIALLQQAKEYPDKKFKIDIFEKRDVYMRRQKLVLFYPENAIVNESIMWDDWVKKIFYPDADIQLDKSNNLLCNGKPFPLPLNARQKFLRKILAQEYETKGANFSLRSLELALKEYVESEKLNNVDLCMHFNAKVDKINLIDTNNHSSITIAKQSHHFDTLFICEGVNREIVNLVNHTIKTETPHVTPFTYKALGIDEKLSNDVVNVQKYYPIHFSSRFIYESDSLPLVKDPIYHKKSTDDLKKLGFDLSDVQVHADDNEWNHSKPAWKLRVSISGRVPPQIVSIEDDQIQKAKLIEYIKIVLSGIYNLPKEKFVIDPKGDSNLNMSTFKLNIKSVDNPVRKLPNGSYIVIGGDCAQTAFHESGFSSELALNGAILSAECLAENIVDGKYDDEYIDPYEPYVRKFTRHQLFLEDYIDKQYNREIHNMTDRQKELLISIKKP